MFAAAAFCAANPSPAASAGETAGVLLTKPLGARVLAMGEASSSLPDDINGFTINPALLGVLPSQTISMCYSSEFGGGRLDSGFYGHPTSLGTLAVGFVSFDAGDLELSQYDGSQRTVRAQQDLLWVLGYGADLSNLLGLSGKWRLSIGLTGKYLYSTIAEEASAGAILGDAGLFLEAPAGSGGAALRLAVAAQNVGDGLKYISKTEKLPYALRGGASVLWCRADGGGFCVTVSGDYPYEVYDREADPRLGCEVWLNRRVALRAGYRFISGEGAMTAGTAVRWRGMELGYAYGAVKDLDAQHRVSLDWRF